MGLKDTIIEFFNPYNLALLMLTVAAIVTVVQLFFLIFGKKIEATIVESYVDSKKGKRMMHYRPMLVYSYAYNNEKYMGRSGWIMNEYRSYEPWAQNVVNANSVGSTITVLVNPLVPFQSVMKSDISLFHWGILLMFVFGIALLFLSNNLAST